MSEHKVIDSTLTVLYGRSKGALEAYGALFRAQRAGAEASEVEKLKVIYRAKLSQLKDCIKGINFSELEEI
jgi:hypothetical protein